ncbi:MAG TPA: lysophospholipid acyltransferase family protein [Gammaproteobacteria bacterium]|nr:lysophospholipid acyltransferase family protein [Gammaproteobacteria bacterium]
MRESRLAGCWRAAASGLCFLGYWTGCLLVAPTALLAIVMLSRSAFTRARRTRRLASASFRLLIRVCRILGIVECEIAGREWLAAAPGRLVLANHPTFLDVIVLLALLPEANCVVKHSLRRHPVLAPFVRACGYLANDTEALAFLAACRDAKARGETLIVFPEGTRSTAGAPLHFQRGAAQIALRAGMEILPVTVYCDPPFLTRQTRWYRAPQRRVRHLVKFHPPVAAEGFAPVAGLEPPLAARRLTRGLQSYFQNELLSP